MSPSDFFIFNEIVLGIWAYTFGVGMFAAYYDEHPPTDCSGCNIFFALVWPSVIVLKLLRRNPYV